MPAYTNPYFWAVNLTRFTAELADSSFVSFTFNGPTYAILDSGTTMMVIDYNSFFTIFSKINSSLTVTSLNGTYVVDCAKLSTAPVLYLYLNLIPFSLSWTDYILHDGIHCYLAFQPTRASFSGQTTWILGTNFC
jgi:hypothetical protein